MTTQPSDDDLWKDAQWDPTSVHERYLLDRDCSIKEFSRHLQSLLRHLRSREHGPATNGEIGQLARMTNERWSRYVDPALSRSSGTIETTAIVLYECADHFFTLRYFDDRWVVLVGEHTRGIIDRPDQSLDLEQLEEENALDELMVDAAEIVVDKETETVNAEPPLIDLLEEEDLDNLRAKEAETDNDLAAHEEAEVLEDKTIAKKDEIIADLRWELETSAREMAEMQKQMDSLREQIRILKMKSRQRDQNH